MQEVTSFIEQQFPVSKVSKESYKERKAVSGQILTGLGKWWGRKPLILIRASIIGMLMPASDNPQKDREIFLKILTMDEDGLWERKEKSIPVGILYESLSKAKQEEYFEHDTKGKPKWQSGVSNEVKQIMQKEVFGKFSYDEKLEYCLRPEQIEGPSIKMWDEINSHLETNAKSIQELVEQLGIKRFGHTPKVGDAFSGGGSIPFESAKIGCTTYASDLNPVSMLLTWSGLNLIGNPNQYQEVIDKQNKAYSELEKNLNELGFETNEKGWKAEAYIYCMEIVHPSSGYRVPLSPTWVISEKFKVVGKLEPDHKNKSFNIKIIENADKDLYLESKKGTVKNSRIIDPITEEDISISAIRGDRKDSEGKIKYGLRLWENDDIIPREEDIFQERLYCIRYVDENGNRHYVEPNEDDIKRELAVYEFVKKNFHLWQEKGFIPSKKIDKGYNTDQPIRERGWTYWHHLFNPRQLLINALMSKILENEQWSDLLIGRFANLNSRNCRWLQTQGDGIGGGKETFDNQALNTLFNYSCRASKLLKSAKISFKKNRVYGTFHTNLKDARLLDYECDLWITDPPYADAINYHELSDFFLAWYDKHLLKMFPEWYSDSKKALAVKGSGEDFKKSMIDIYSNLAKNMPDNGLQMVQFTHQDPSVWADLAMILWASGLRVTAAWTIGTETSTGLKTGNYVQGTVLLILKKRLDKQSTFISDIYIEIEDEVKDQLDNMHKLDDNEDPNFADTDYQLAAYAAALRVLTWYDIEGYDVKHELFRERKKGEKNQFEQMIDKAVEIATNYLIPDGIDKIIWRDLGSDERFYLKGLELEKHGEMRSGAYQEMAKGFGVKEYTSLFAKTTANAVRFKTPSEFKKAQLNSSGFGETTIRQLLFAVSEVTRTESVKEGINYLRAEISDYWNKRKLLMALLKYFIRFDQIEHMSHWQIDVNSSKLLSGAIDNDTPGA